MIIKFFKGDDVIIGDERGDKIKTAIMSGAEWLDINGGLYKVSNISSVLPSKGQVKIIGGVSNSRKMMERLIEERKQIGE